MATSEVTSQDIINVQTSAKIDNQNTKLDAFIEEMRDFKNEMRQQNQMRANEIMEIRNDIKEIYKTTDSKIDSIRQSIQTMQNQNIAVIIGVIAIAVAVFLK